MPAKLSTVCYVHECTERLTQEYTVKEVTAVVRLDDADPTKVVYLKVKIFIPSDQNISTQIEDFEKVFPSLRTGQNSPFRPNFKLTNVGRKLV
ncbi:hypothetical protein RhiirA4_480227 [Rhizophagus irregularis]|uniref:Uncharacterized protein n=1 Tax=Rhizophagus irregularis TaxID=588596 RepID=A0A2I1HHR6_9GLOM|nr:hypothetical protein RhiirA4_480227 [Rhizophagus irregularis]